MYTRLNHYVAVLIYLVAAVIIVRQPLFGNFGYEYAASFALIGSLIAGLIAIRDERRTSAVPPQVRFRNGLVMNIVYIGIPLIVIFLASLPGLPCDPVAGLTFYALLPLVSIVFAYILGWLVSMVFRWGRFVFILLMIISLGLSILSTIVQPKIFFYNPFIGFFPGLSYDHLMPVTSTLVLYRAYTLFLAVVFLLVIYMLRFTPLRDASLRDRIRLLRHTYANSFLSIFITIGIILIFVQILSRSVLGFSTTYGHLENVLGNNFETRTVNIYYSSESFDEDEIKWVVLEHEFSRRQAMSKLGVMHVGQISSYLYPDPETKRTLIGPARTNIAKPWSKEIHINADDYKRSLLHEIAHVTAGEFGMPVLRISNSTAMLEGIAMATEGVWGNRTLHEHAAAIQQFGLIDDPALLLDNRHFARHHSSLSYVLMGSFVQFLIDRYGIHRVRAAYSWSDYETAFDRPREQLVREWTNVLQRITVSERQRTKTLIHFKRPSIFGLECPRTLARLNRSAREYMEDKRYDRAEELYTKSWEMVRNGTALEGLIRVWFHLGEYEQVLSYLEDESLREEFPGIIPVLYLTAGDIYALNDDLEQAERYYKRLLAIDYSDAVNEFLRIRLLALDAPGDTDLWRLLFFEPEDREAILESLAGQVPDNDISLGLQWVLARYYHNNGDYLNSSTYHILLRNNVEDNYLKYLATKRIGGALFYQGKFQDSVLEFWNAMNYTESPAAVHSLNEWIDRAQYADEYGDLIWENLPPWR